MHIDGKRQRKARFNYWLLLGSFAAAAGLVILALRSTTEELGDGTGFVLPSLLVVMGAALAIFSRSTSLNMTVYLIDCKAGVAHVFVGPAGEENWVAYGLCGRDYVEVDGADEFSILEEWKKKAGAMGLIAER